MLQRYLGHDLDFLGSCDVICHVTIGFAIWGSYGWSIRTDRLTRTVIAIHYGQLSFANVRASIRKMEKFSKNSKFNISKNI